jgi:magnesium-protoporphyrin IX monomethyl ester (oxidative) cyclase
MRSDQKLLKGTNRLWIRFFQLAVFATMFVRDHQRPIMHKALNLNPTEYDMQVFKITTEISKQVFPVLLDIENPKFLSLLNTLNDTNIQIEKIKANGVVSKFIIKSFLMCKIAIIFCRLFFIKPIINKLPEEMRVKPSW